MHLNPVPPGGSRSIAQFQFETNTLDSSGFGNNGFTVGIPNYVSGHSGQALELDGTNSFIQLPSNVANSSQFSFAAWIYWNGGGNWQRIFDFGDDTLHYLFLTPSSSGGTLRFAIRNGGGEQIVETAGLASGQWQHIAVTLSGNTALLYTNGALAASSSSITLAPSNFNPAKNYLGKSQFSADPLFRGRLDEVQIADYALSASQIAALSTNSPPAFATNLIARPGGTPNVAYSSSIAGEATDPNPGDTLAYSKASGPAWLTVAPNGTLSGTPGPADSGTNHFTVRATDSAGASAFAVLTIALPLVYSSGTWNSDANGNWSDTNRWNGGIVANGPGFTADLSAINISANRTVTLDSSRGIGTLKFGDISGGQSWTLASSNGAALTLDTGSAAQPAMVVTNTATIAGSLAGANGFIKSGPGTLILAASNSLSGTVNIDTSSTGSSEGAVRAAHPAALAKVTALQIRDNNSGSSTLELDGSNGNIIVPGAIALNGRNSPVPAIQNRAGTNTLAGNLTINVGGANYWLQSDAGLLTMGGNFSSAATGTRTFTFQGDGDISVTGIIANGSASTVNVTQLGPGKLTLAANNTYNGATTLSGGTLLVNGSIGAVSVTGGTLGGGGTITSAVTIPGGATLSPGLPGQVGDALTISNTLTLAGATFIRLNKVALTNDSVRGISTLTYGGTLTVTNLGGTLMPGDSFRLFSASSYTGAFGMTHLPPLASGQQWMFSPTNGTLSVVRTVNPNPTNITATVNGSTLQLSWPSDHIGWQLQTNGVSVADPNSWFTLPDSSSTNLVLIPIDPALTNVFFRLVAP